MKKASTGDKSVKWVFSKRQVQGQPVAESDYVDLADNICDETAPEGAWLKETRLKVHAHHTLPLPHPACQCNTLFLRSPQLLEITLTPVQINYGLVFRQQELKSS